MWEWIASRILRNRTGILVVLGLFTAFMAWKAREVKMSYKMGGLLPRTDSTYRAYQDFLARFSEDGNVMAIGVEDPALYTPEHFAAWHALGRELKAIDGIDSVFSEAHLYTLVRDDSLKRLDARPLMRELPATQEGMDSLRAAIRDLPFYRGLLYNEETQASLMMVFVNAATFNTPAREAVLDLVMERVEAFRARTGITAHMSGLPYIRVRTAALLKGEMPRFVGMAMGVTALLLLLFFRSWRVMLFSMITVAVAVVWAFGTIGLMEFPLTSLMSVIPPLLIVIGVPNCVFLINKYHHEYVRHGNKVKALQRVISKVGTAAFMTNATTALGFGTFMVTYSDSLRQFGFIAALNIMLLFCLAVLLIPILFSLQAPPKPRHTQHLERRWLDTVVEWLVHTVRTRRTAVFLVLALVVAAGMVGMQRLRNDSHIVDDLPENDPVLTDMRFFEKHFHGVMPLEILVDTRKKGGALKDATLKRIDRLQDSLALHPELSPSLSIANAVKFSRQAFYGGNPERYGLIKSNEKAFILPYIESISDNPGAKKGSMARAFLDSARQTTRISVQMADIGTLRMKDLMAQVKPRIDSIFPAEQYHVTLTGTSVVFLKGSRYMVDNLIVSLGLAIVLIAFLMALIFNSARMVVVSLVPNLVPLLTTAGLMGFLGIPIKPSTILVFSVAFGIAVDNAIHLLAKYRQELKNTGRDHARAVELAIRETGIGIIYTAVVLFCGFVMFTTSKFGGIQAMGLLVSITLLVALFTNLLVLPSLMLATGRRLATKAFEEPLLELMDEEEDIDLDELKVEAPEQAKHT
ncbi:MAG: MMPL family transporter [Flavobacteriales bacterium]|nr:MMPL family transporter [Flavobacteriales bacterium]